MIPAHNPLVSPVVIDAKGRQLGGGEWGPVDPEERAVIDAEAAHRLILFPQGLPDDCDPAVRAACYPSEVATPDTSAPGGDDDTAAAPAAPTSKRSR